MTDEKKIKLEIKWPQVGDEITTKAGMTYVVGQLIGKGAFSIVHEGIDLFGNSVASPRFLIDDGKEGM